mgnify:FL=1
MSSFNNKGLRKNRLKERKAITNQLKYFSIQMNVFSDTINECIEVLEAIENKKNEVIITETVNLMAIKNNLSENLIQPMINKLMFNYNLIEDESGNNSSED